MHSLVRTGAGGAGFLCPRSSVVTPCPQVPRPVPTKVCALASQEVTVRQGRVVDLRPVGRGHGGVGCGDSGHRGSPGPPAESAGGHAAGSRSWAQRTS